MNFVRDISGKITAAKTTSFLHENAAISLHPAATDGPNGALTRALQQVLEG